MCGIAGIASSSSKNPVSTPLLKAMCAQMPHRGPDGSGEFVNSSRSVGLSHLRLNIIDLKTGSQPMRRRQNVISYNGEVYNFRELRKELELGGQSFSTSSDTEVVLAAYEKFGVEMLSRLNGMFAGAIWDEAESQLFLFRDRCGEKPLFYTISGGRLAFSSEIKSLFVLPWVTRQVRPSSVSDFLRLRYVPGPQTMWEGINKLPPGHYLNWKNGRIEIVRYWAPYFSVRPSLDERETQQQFAELLEDSVRMRLVADVPVGVFLSGGIDSATVASLMAAHSTKPIQSFSIGFGDANDETNSAESLATLLKADHSTLKMTAADLRLLPDAVRFMEEPLGDAILVPMLLLARMAAKKVKVVLTGEGADELLGGYIHQKNMYRLISASHRAGKLGAVGSHLLAKLISRAPARLLNPLFDYPDALGESGKRRLCKLLESFSDASSMYELHTSLFSRENLSEILKDGLSSPPNDHFEGLTGDDLFSRLLETDFNRWLPDNILLKQDKMTMAASLEGRVPFLDHRLVEFAGKVPMAYKLQGSITKKVLRETASRWVPKNYLNQNSLKKQAFHVPLSGAYRIEFENLVREWLSESRLKESGWYHLNAIKDLVRSEHLRPQLLQTKQVMALVILEMWRTQWSSVPVFRESSPEVTL